MTGRSVREFYRGTSAALLPEVTHVGWTDLTRSRPEPLGPHRHEGAFEICYVLRGHVDWWAESEVYEVPHRHLYMTQPDELHGGVDSVLHPCELYWIGVRLPTRGCWAGLSRARTRELREELVAIRRRVFPAPVAIIQPFRAVLAEHRDRQPHSELAARGALLALLVAVLRAQHDFVSGRTSPKARLSDASRRAMGHASSRRVDVGEMARAAGRSVSRFHACFVQETGQTPAEWLRRRRISEAKRQLLTGRRSIVALAYDLGFPSSQYFATVFAQYTGLTPSAYRARDETAGT